MSTPEVVLPRRLSAARRGGMVPPLLVAVVCAAYATGAALSWGSPVVARLMGDFGLSAAALCSAVSCGSYALAVPSRSRPAWALFGTSSLMVAAGNGVWGWYEVVLREPVPATSAADFCFLLFAPPTIVGLLVLAQRPCTRAGWVCLGLDCWLIAGSLITLSWTLALARTAEGEHTSLARTALTLGYPLLDILLVSVVLALHFRRFAINRAAVNTALAALAVTILSDALFTSPALRESYHSGEILDAGWFAGSMLLAYAPWVSTRGDAAATPKRQPGPRIAGALIPYIAAGVCTLGILYTVLDGRKADRVVLVIGCLVVLALVVRQGIMLVDNVALTQELAQQENHFRSLVQGSSDVIMIAAPTGVLRYVSPASQGVYGRDADELVGTELAALIHPEDRGRVLCEVRRFLAAAPAEEPAIRIQCRILSGTGYWLHVESSVNRYQDGLIFNSRDVTERVRLQAQLQHNASHDSLTDLPNRALFTERVRQSVAGRRADDGMAAVLFIDLDGFKAVNDSVGHQAGDELLVLAACRLQESVRVGDVVARLGGDEFAALIGGCGQDRQLRERQIREVADRLRATLSEPYVVGGTQVRVAASIGVAFAEPATTPTELMRNADLAMYRAKSAGKGRVEVYSPQMQAEAMRRVELASRLRTALHEGKFTLLHQPVVHLRTGEIVAVEAQARWRSAEGILFTPAEFLTMAEDTERTADFGRWIIEEAVEQAAHRHHAGQGSCVVVKLSAHRLLCDGLPAQCLDAVLAGHDLPPGSLIVELSGTGPSDCLEELGRRLAALKRLGVRLALDGFGTGDAPMSALRRLPVDIVKLDRTFAAEVVESARQHKLTAGLLGIAADLGLTTVADGIDLPEQARILRDLGCLHGQGMAFSGPLDERRLRAALVRGSLPVPCDAAAPPVPTGMLPVRRVESGPGVQEPVDDRGPGSRSIPGARGASPAPRQHPG